MAHAKRVGLLVQDHAWKYGEPDDFAVFDAKPNSSSERDSVLYQLTMAARQNGLSVDKSALAFRENGRNTFYGDKDLVDYLSKRSIPRWTHHLDI